MKRPSWRPGPRLRELSRRRAARPPHPRSPHRPPERRRTWPQRLVLGLGALGVVAFGASAAAIGFMYRKVEMIPRVELGHVLAEPVESGTPRNVLLVGVDNAEDLSPDDPILAERDASTMLSDTIMILRLDPTEEQAALLSIPRDLWVTFPGSGAEARINSSIWRGNGSPDVLIDLIDEMLGIPIHNYVQVDLYGFRELVDVVDGVPVHFDRPARDEGSGLRVYETGCVLLGPDQALAYARSRFYEELVDGSWEREARSDLGRIQRQQDFLRRIADRAVNRGARNPGTLNRLLDAALGSLTVDGDLSTGDILGLAERFRSFDPQNLRTYVLPVENDTVGSAEVLQLVEHEAEPLLEYFRGEAEPSTSGAGDTSGPGSGDDSARGGGTELDPSEVTATVLNGSGRSGQAGDAGAALVEAGFGVVGQDNASQFGLQRTEVRYPPDLETEAETLAAWLESGAELVETGDVAGVTVVTGDDWDGVRSSPGSDAVTPRGPRTSTTADPTATTAPDPGAGAGGDPDTGEGTGAGEATGDGDGDGDGDTSGAGGGGSDDADDGGPPTSVPPPATGAETGAAPAC